jgi:hypothetical protein
MRTPLSGVAERHESLWLLTLSPAMWAAHLLLCYVTAAIWCAKQPSALAPLGGVRTAVVAYTVAALAGIAIVGWIGYRAHRHGDDPPPHDADTPEDRHRFMGFATLLLSGLSAVAVVYAALVALFFETCQ